MAAHDDFMDSDDVDTTYYPVIDVAWRQRYSLRPEIIIPDKSSSNYAAGRFARHCQIAAEVDAYLVAEQDCEAASKEGEVQHLSDALVADALKFIEENILDDVDETSTQT